MSLSHSQRGVAIGAASAAVVSAITLVFAALHPASQAASTLEARLHLLAVCSAAPAVALLIAIGRLANQRFGSPEDIDGSGLTAGSARAKLLQALLQNTLEQLALALPVYIAVSLLGSSRLLSILPAAAAH